MDSALSNEALDCPLKWRSTKTEKFENENGTNDIKTPVICEHRGTRIGHNLFERDTGTYTTVTDSCTFNDIKLEERGDMGKLENISDANNNIGVCNISYEPKYSPGREEHVLIVIEEDENTKKVSDENVLQTFLTETGFHGLNLVPVPDSENSLCEAVSTETSMEAEDFVLLTSDINGNNIEKYYKSVDIEHLGPILESNGTVINSNLGLSALGLSVDMQSFEVTERSGRQTAIAFESQENHTYCIHDTNGNVVYKPVPRYACTRSPWNFANQLSPATNDGFDNTSSNSLEACETSLDCAMSVESDDISSNIQARMSEWTNVDSCLNPGLTSLDYAYLDRSLCSTSTSCGQVDEGSDDGLQHMWITPYQTYSDMEGNIYCYDPASQKFLMEISADERKMDCMKINIIERSESYSTDVTDSGYDLEIAMKRCRKRGRKSTRKCAMDCRKHIEQYYAENESKGNGKEMMDENEAVNEGTLLDGKGQPLLVPVPATAEEEAAFLAEVRQGKYGSTPGFVEIRPDGHVVNITKLFKKNMRCQEVMIKAEDQTKKQRIKKQPKT